MNPQINCEQFEFRIQSFMDERQDFSTDADLQQHAKNCESCRELMKSFQELDDSFSGKIPVNLTQQLQILDEKPFNPAWPIVCTIAAILAVSCLIWFSSHHFNNNQSTRISQNSGLGAFGNPNVEISIEDLNSIDVEKLSNVPALEKYIRYSSELPGVRPIQGTFFFAWDLLQKSLFRQKLQESLGPEFGEISPYTYPSWM